MISTVCSVPGMASENSCICFWARRKERGTRGGQEDGKERDKEGNGRGKAVSRWMGRRVADDWEDSE
jgi:hypothetical protein